MRLSRKDTRLGCDFETAKIQCMTLNKLCGFSRKTFPGLEDCKKDRFRGEGVRELKKKI